MIIEPIDIDYIVLYQDTLRYCDYIVTDGNLLLHRLFVICFDMLFRFIQYYTILYNVISYNVLHTYNALYV